MWQTIETFKKICEGKQKWAKGKLETFRTQTLFKYKYPIDLPFRFEIYQKCSKLVKHRDLLAYVVVFNSCDTTWFLQPESTTPSQYNVCTCADVWLLLSLACVFKN